MGQKAGKPSLTGEDLVKEIAYHNNITLTSSNNTSSAASTTSSSKSKSNHYSAISNDSGCYCNTDRYSSPSGSSLLYLYDLTSSSTISNSKTETTKQPHSTAFENLKNSKTRRNSNNSHRTVLRNNIQLLNQRNSLCDSIILSCSSSSSNSCLNSMDEVKAVTTMKNVSAEVIGEKSHSNNNEINSDKRAQLLCYQLNKILNISTILASEEIAIASQQNHTSKKQPTKSMKLKTLSGNKAAATTRMRSTSRNKTMNRSFTFSANAKDLEKMNACTKNVLENFLNSSNENLPSTTTTTSKESATETVLVTEDESFKRKKLSSLILKNGRRFLSTLNSKRGGHQHETPVIGNKLYSVANGQPLTSGRQEENLINRIAAKLLSEAVDLTRSPYSDEYGFCKIPIALIKRYACELEQDIELVAKCFEAERLSQLEKQGKLGVNLNLVVVVLVVV